jgi:hypothetical protein
MFSTLRIVIILAITALLSQVCSADIVTLKDGTTHEGVIVKETRAEVVLEIMISNIKTTKTFPRYKVRSVEYKPVEDSKGSQEATSDSTDEVETEQKRESATPRKPATRNRRVSAADRTTFIEIPIQGMIGMQTNATGLRNALLQAKKKGVSHIVFTIDSPGGYLYDAIEALKILNEYDEAFVYHAMVEEGAISAASIYVAAADQIWVRQQGRVGGAVAYSENTSSGAAEVDAKLNSIWAADIATRAQLKGHPPEVFRAMVEPAAELWVDAEGKSYSSRPSTPGAQQLDNQRSVLTIRADQMVKIGMAKEFDGKLGELGEYLDLEHWFEVKTIGIRAMERAAKERADLHDRYEHAAKVFTEALEEYEQDHPENFRDYRFIRDKFGNYHADGPSYQKWRDRIDLTVRHCNIMLEALGRMAAVNKSAAKIGAVHLEYLPDDFGDDVYKEIRTERDRLLGMRHTPPSR